MQKIQKLALLVVIILFPIIIVQAAETLVVSHFLGAKSPQQARFLEPWAKKIEKESRGKIKVEIFPSMTLGGKPADLYRQVRDGVADIVWTLIGYTPGVFPRSEVFELPSVHQGSAIVTNLAIQDTFELIAEDYKDIKPLLVHVHTGNVLHLIKGCVDNVSDFKSLKLRTASRTGGWMISAWGAEPVGMPITELPQALFKGVVNGTLIPFEVITPLKIHELVQCSITGESGIRFGTSVFLFAMNKDRYNKLPKNLQAVIDANSGRAIAEQTGEVSDNNEIPGIALQKKTGSSIIEFSSEVTKDIASINQLVEKRWIKEVTKKRIDGKQLVSAARSAVIKNSK